MNNYLLSSSILSVNRDCKIVSCIESNSDVMNMTLLLQSISLNKSLTDRFVATLWLIWNQMRTMFTFTLRISHLQYQVVDY